MRKTKIICTMGPATDVDGVLEKLIEEGMNVARFNFSHGTHEEQKRRMDQLKKLTAKCKKPIALLLDTKGPEIRIGTFEQDRITLSDGDEFVLSAKACVGNQERVSITYPKLWEEVSPGTAILIDDGLVELTVEQIKQEDIVCKVVNGGEISNRKGVNIPGVHINLPYMSSKDKNDILFGIEQDVDFIAASFVRSAADVKQVRALLDANGGEDIHIIAKIENREGVDNIDAIIESADAIMIARGDMGVELPQEEVPIVQKMIIKKVYQAGKQVITATQMLDSMMVHKRPTRAESTDVANAIYDGTSAIMLSGETAAGKYPIEALQTMVKIADKTEEAIDYKHRFFLQERKANPDITDAISHATCTTAHDLNASAIITVSKSGRSARMISRYRPACDIIGCTTTPKICRQMNMSWGVTPVVLKEQSEVFTLFTCAIAEAKKQKLVKEGDVVVITSGVPIGLSGTTNMIKVEKIENAGEAEQGKQ